MLPQGENSMNCLDVFYEVNKHFCQYLEVLETVFWMDQSKEWAAWIEFHSFNMFKDNPGQNITCFITLLINKWSF